jgi:hypothetical protein
MTIALNVLTLALPTLSSWHSRSKNGVASLAYSRSKNGVASLAYSRSKNGVARLCPAISVFVRGSVQDVDARHKSRA